MIKNTGVSGTVVFAAAALSLGLSGCATEAERMAEEGYPPGLYPRLRRRLPQR